MRDGRGCALGGPSELAEFALYPACTTHTSLAHCHCATERDAGDRARQRPPYPPLGMCHFSFMAMFARLCLSNLDSHLDFTPPWAPLCELRLRAT